MEYDIKKLTVDYYKEIIGLWKTAGLPYRPKGRDSYEKMSREFKLEHTAFIGMLDKDKLIGVVLASSDGRKGWINRLAIHPDYRGRGLAGILIKASEDFIYSLGIDVIAALIEDYNENSFRTFEKAGYKLMKEVKYLSKRPSADS